MARFSVQQLSPPLRTRSAPQVTVYEVDTGLVRTGWVIADRARTPQEVTAALNQLVARRSYGVVCADLMLGIDLAATVSE